MAERALEFDAVSAGYGETVVLENIRLALAAGEVSEENLTRWIRDNWPADAKQSG